MSIAGEDDQGLAGQLQHSCPSYFREDDKIYYAANAELRRAQTLQGSARQDITRAALEKLVKVNQERCTTMLYCSLPYLSCIVTVSHCIAAGLCMPRCSPEKVCQGESNK